jgi:PST family polysaccharide transporter
VLLFSAEFTPSLNLLRWLLIADYLKLLSWVLAFPMLAFSHLRLYFVSELVANIGLLGVCYWSLENSNSLEGIGIAVLTLYSCYLFFTLWFVWRYYLFLPTFKTALASGFGLAAVLGAAGYSWYNI